MRLRLVAPVAALVALAVVAAALPVAAPQAGAAVWQDGGGGQDGGGDGGGGDDGGSSTTTITSTTDDTPVPAQDIIPEPNSGRAPDDAGDRGGVLQGVVFLFIVVGIGGAVTLVVRESRRSRSRSAEG
ncbi:MAG: hypothetical protein ACRDZN_16545 [Acidimicrobiales bacterium]